MIQQVFSSPEMLDEKQSRVGLSQKETPKIPARPELMSALFQGAEPGTVKPEIEQVQVASPLIESFASLRTDAVRNPESAQNQATVKSIMKKRQRRVMQREMD